MRMILRPRSALTAACIVSLVVSALAWAAMRGPDGAEVTSRPARSSARIGSALYLSVARAGERLVAVGERGFVLLSDDGGRQWRQAREVPVSVTLTNVQFVSAEQGWAVGHGGVVLHSGDGGETWRRQLDGNEAAARVLADARAALAAAEADPVAQRLVREAEGLVADGADKPLLGLHFTDARHGRVVGAYGLALATDDGGATWRSIMRDIDNRGGKHLYDVRAAGADLVIAGEQGTLFRAAGAAEGGAAPFVPVATPYAGTWFGTVAGVRGELLAFGLRGNVYRRLDEWTQWQRIDSGAPVTVTAGLQLADGSLVLADAGGRVLRSRDAGRSLAALPAVAGRSFTGIAQASDGALVLSGAGGMTRIEAAVLAAAPGEAEVEARPPVEPKPPVDPKPAAEAKP